jgi:hypothetical protein
MTRIALGHALMLALAGLLRTAAMLYAGLWVGVAASGGHPRAWIAVILPLAPLLLTVVTARLAASTGHVLRVVPFAACAAGAAVALALGAESLGDGPAALPALVLAATVMATAAVAALADETAGREVTYGEERVKTATGSPRGRVGWRS